MGVDLTLIPFPKRMLNSCAAHAHTVLSLSRSRRLFDWILSVEKKHGHPIPDDFHTYLSRDEAYEESHYGPTTTTPYGDHLLYVPVARLWPLAAHQDIAEDYENRAAWAYLLALTNDWLVALYWH